MERYVRHNLRVLAEPITILANPTYLPPAGGRQYDRLWTDAADAADHPGGDGQPRGLGDQRRSGCPTSDSSAWPKKMGAKFTFGSNNFDDHPIDMSRCIEAIDRYGLTKDDMYVPCESNALVTEAVTVHGQRS